MEDIVAIIKSCLNYKNINKLSDIKLRNSSINLHDAIYYRFAYSNIHKTKDNIVASLNIINDTNHTRQGYDSKDNNIPTAILKLILNKLSTHYNSINNSIFANTIIAIDGTYNNNNKHEEILNMGFYDIGNSIPIDIKSFGKEGKNKEIRSTTDYITNNIDIFRNTIIVGDRAYFCYKFMKFLNDNNIYFIIRSRGDANNLDPDTTLKKGTNDYNIIMNLRNNIRHIDCRDVREKIIYEEKKKKEIKKYVLHMEEKCHLVTNMLNKNTYSNKQIIDIYKARWDIEVFFKYLKGNFKFRHLLENDKNDSHRKLHLCELIITCIAKIIEKDVKGKNNKTRKIKINESHLVRGIYDHLLYDIIHGKVKDETYIRFCKSYIKEINNKKDRFFPRISKTPFTKWYTKGYSNNSQIIRIIIALLSNTAADLPKNLKTKAKRIKKINGKKVNV